MMILRFSFDLRLSSLLFGCLWLVCHGSSSSSSECPPCDPGQLCHPPAFPDMLSTFQDTLDHSPVIRNLTEMLLSSLVLTSCRYSLLTTIDWTDFNARRCTTEADELRSSDEACRHVVSSSHALDFARLRPLQPFSLSAESHGEDGEDEEEEDYYEEEEDEDEEEDGVMEEIEVDKDTYGDDDDGGGGGDEVGAAGGWMVSSSRPQSNPRRGGGLAMYPQGIALIIGISCSILSLVCGIVILIYIRRRYYSHPKYETPPEEAVCLRWMQSRFGVGDGTTSSNCQHPCYSTAAEERMRTNPPGHPIKRYL